VKLQFTIEDLHNKQIAINDAKVAVQNLYANGYIDYVILKDAISSLEVSAIQMDKWVTQRVKEKIGR
jgi:hypothetical protein